MASQLPRRRHALLVDAGTRTVDPPTKSCDGHLDDTVMSPLEERTANSTGQPHCRLAHHDCPGHLSPGALTVRKKTELGVPDEIARNRCVDGPGGLASDKRDFELYAVRKWWANHSVEDISRRKTTTFHPELGEPGPPGLELVGLLDSIPQKVRCEIEAVTSPIGEGGIWHKSQRRGCVFRLILPVGAPRRARPQPGVDQGHGGREFW